MTKYKILCIAGTRPELIKLFPVYRALTEKIQFEEKDIKVLFALTGQHNELIKDLFDFFDFQADHILDLKSSFVSRIDSETVQKEYPLSDLSAKIQLEVSRLLAEEKPDLVIVQGDTMSSAESAISAFYQKIPIAHVEAGIRTTNIYSPYPEEFLRRSISEIANLNFAPTKSAFLTLEAEKVLYRRKHAFNFNVGNTGIDALAYACERIAPLNFNWEQYKITRDLKRQEDIDLLEYLDSIVGKKIILVTGHRRENQDLAHTNLAQAIYKSAKKYPDVEFIISLHKNPLAQKAFLELDSEVSNIKCLEALSYPLFVKLMQSAYFIVTDSGGIQEEAPYLEKPVLVCRRETERQEGISAGFAKLIGIGEEGIYSEITKLIEDHEAYTAMVNTGLELYGDGFSASKIADIVVLYLEEYL